jgi:hypothetical protein
VQYIKPVQTGYPQDSDSRLVVRGVLSLEGGGAPQEEGRGSCNGTYVLCRGFHP